jgi:ppGpp synthetase/RelA/SpoT-type nucleotidyltranferase
VDAVTENRLTGGAIDRLGDRLRLSTEISADDLALLQHLRREFDDALARARDDVVRALPGVSPTSRLKTVQTLVGKLQRESTMNLGQVQDVAGLRIVRDMTIEDQDRLASQVEALFPGAKLIDRRAKPSFGYRAVHIVAKVDGRLVEIQLRTQLQDRWAQIVERLADHWGRSIRYGGLPDDPERTVGRYSRAEVVELARRLSPLIEQCEKSPGVTGRRVQLSGDAFCRSVADTLSLFGRLDVVGKVA